MFLGVPFNIASYSLLVYILAKICGLKPGTLVHSIGDAHIYNNHFDQVREILKRETLVLPTLEMPEFSSLEEVLELKTSDFVLKNYEHHDPITAPMAV